MMVYGNLGLAMFANQLLLFGFAIGFLVKIMTKNKTRYVIGVCRYHRKGKFGILNIGKYLSLNA